VLSDEQKPTIGLWIPFDIMKRRQMHFGCYYCH
jgi:hypothetical protein